MVLHTGFTTAGPQTNGTTWGIVSDWCENCLWISDDASAAQQDLSLEENPVIANISEMNPQRHGFVYDAQSNNATQNDNSSDCGYQEAGHLDDRFALVTVFGTAVCILGFISNCLLLHLLVRSTLIRTHVYYLAVLAICDLVTEVSYVALMSMQVLYDYNKDLQLYLAWNAYLKSVYTVTHVTLTIATYMIVAASGEKYLASRNCIRGQCTKKQRWLVTLAVICFALVSKGLVYWEVDVIYKENCTDFAKYVVRQSPFAMNPPYRIGYTLWFRNIVHVFLPFILLTCMNAAILFRLKRGGLERIQSALVHATLGDIAKERKKSIRAATMMLGAIVTTYLVSNLLNVVVTIWESIDYEYLISHRKFYTFAADTVSLLTVLTGAIRFPIYCACNQQLRREFRRLCTTWFRGTRLIADLGKRLCFNAKEKDVESTCVKEDGQIAFNSDLDVTTALTESV